MFVVVIVVVVGENLFCDQNHTNQLYSNCNNKFFKDNVITTTPKKDKFENFVVVAVVVAK